MEEILFTKTESIIGDEDQWVQVQKAKLTEENRAKKISLENHQN